MFAHCLIAVVSWLPVESQEIEQLRAQIAQLQQRLAEVELAVFGRNPGPVAERGVDLTADARVRRGQVVLVEWRKRWWTAKVIGVDASGVRIHYVGWDRAWDEVVARKRVRLPAKSFRRGDLVLVEWGGRWWPGLIKGAQEGGFDITYDGWDDKWDEVVGSERLRRR